MEALSYIEWRNQHSVHEFPFVGSSEYFSNGIFADISVAAYGTTDVWLSSLSVGSDTLSGELATGLGHKMSFSSGISGIGGSRADILSLDGRSVGAISFCLGAEEQIKSTKKSSFVFEDSVAVDPSCVFVVGANCLSALSIGGQTYSGIINLIAGEGVTITGTGSKVAINAVGASPAHDPCCPDRVAVRTINGVAPERGRLLVRPSDTGQPQSPQDPRQLVRVTGASNGILIFLSN